MSHVLVYDGSTHTLPLPAPMAWPYRGQPLSALSVPASHHQRQHGDYPLQFSREVCVDKNKQPGGSMGIMALTQSHTGLLAQGMVMIKQRARQTVTALRTMDDQVRLYSWRVNADGSLLRTGSGALTLAAVQQVAMVHARNYVVACRTQSGELQLSRWDVSNTGAIYLAGAHTNCGQGIQWIEVVALAPDLLAVLALTTAQRWQVMFWQLQGDSDVVLLGVQEMPAALVASGALALLPPRGDNLRLATLVATEQERFALHLWQGPSGDTLTLQATDTLLLPDVVAIVGTYVDDAHLAVVVHTTNGQLRLLTWRLSPAGELTLLDGTTVLANGVGQCMSQRYQDGFALVYRTVDGELCVQQWQQQPTGVPTLLAAGRGPAAPHGEVICCNEALEGNAPLLTGVIDERGEVTLITWRQG